MSLLLEVLGCAFAATLVVAFVGGDRPTRATVARAVAAVAVGVVAVAALTSLWPSTKRELDARENNAKNPRAEKDVAGARVVSINVAFVDWLGSRIGRNETFALANENGNALQWISYRLTPRWMAASPKDADWLIFYGATAKQAGYDASELTDVQAFQSNNFFIARPRRTP